MNHLVCWPKSFLDLILCVIIPWVLPCHIRAGGIGFWQYQKQNIFLRKTFYVFVPSPQSNLLKTTNPFEEFQLVYYSENIDFETFRRHYIWLGGDVSQMKHSAVVSRQIMEERSSSKKIQFTPLSDFRFPSVFGYQTGIKKTLRTILWRQVWFLKRASIPFQSRHRFF